jgi:hypothetical protein
VLPVTQDFGLPDSNSHDSRRASTAVNPGVNILKFNPRHEWALADLAKLYAGPLNQPANAQPLVSRLQKLYPTIAGTWIATASLVCSEEDKSECRTALRRYLDLADENDPDEKPRIDFARMQLKELDQKPAPAKG